MPVWWRIVVLTRWFAVVGSYISLTFLVNAASPMISGLASLLARKLYARFMSSRVVTQARR